MFYWGFIVFSIFFLGVVSCFFFLGLAKVALLDIRLLLKIFLWLAFGAVCGMGSYLYKEYKHDRFASFKRKDGSFSREKFFIPVLLQGLMSIIAGGIIYTIFHVQAMMNSGYYEYWTIVSLVAAVAPETTIGLSGAYLSVIVQHFASSFLEKWGINMGNNDGKKETKKAISTVKQVQFIDDGENIYCVKDNNVKCKPNTKGNKKKCI